MNNTWATPPTPLRNPPTSYTPSPESQEPKAIQAPCQSCGRLVWIILPFVGCVFCGECGQPKVWQQQASVEDFTFPTSINRERGA